MKVTQEKLPQSRIGLEIEIPPDQSKNAYEQVVQKLARTVNIPGFRKGKVPRQILLQQLGQTRIKATALEELIQSSLQQALKQEAIEPLGNYQLRSDFDELVGQFKPGEPLTFIAAVDVQPEVSLGDYTGLTVKAEEVPYDPSTVEKFLEERRAELANLIPVEGRPAQMGDVAVVDYSSRLADEPEGEETESIAGGQAEDAQIELVEGKFLKEFVDGIVGMSSGETKQISVNFPEDYRQDLAGKTAIFSITLKDLKEKELPALDDDFAQEVSEFETLAELQESLEKRFRDKAEQETKANKEQALVSELLLKVEADLPETMIQQEVETMLRQTIMQMGQMGIDVKSMFTPEMVKQMGARSRPEAIDRLKQSLALEEIAKRESLQAEPEAITARVNELLEQFPDDQNIDRERLHTIVSADLLKEKAISWLEEHGTIELVPQGTLTPEEDEETEVEVTATEATETETAEETEATEATTQTAQPDAESSLE
ncbi:trigger factor [Funiculus sociatus GB2-A5]|uniref:Trigger factor n=1 Tax=Funiculus sociatus GB2-A5 TaxID=2933946 RepID=A0ABV0JN88_9CYAN|nr:MULTISPECIES: trigger factor [unclassified Trichocoleus]MBD1906411.1 trigger factor [Trichocoleus sp. FACHB-832]MBD2064966.1 trigger factor [Trichocoleus sp. FACHB-6]